MLTNGRREYQIDIYSLSNDLHEYDFEINDILLSTPVNSILERGKGTCHIKLQKSETMITLHFSIDAKVELTCDRSLDKFQHPITLEEDVMVKFGEEEKVLNEEVFVIRKDSPSIFVDEIIYEFISLAVPMKKLHPRYEGVESPDLVYSSPAEEVKNDEEVDPRWEALKKLKENKN